MTTSRAAFHAVERLFAADSGTLTGLDDAALWERFAHRRDEAAFEALVGRHGSMVLRAARAILGDHHSAEDVFQTTFITLARRGETIRRFETLAPWLHRVACRAAVRLRNQARRRAARERRATEPATSQRADLVAAVHAELDRLPAAYRAPIVLCDLEGWTKASAAAHLGWTEGTVRGRLERGRARLRARLTRQGFAPSVGWLAASLGGITPEASALGLAARSGAVAPSLVAAAVRAGVAATAPGAGPPAWLGAIGSALQSPVPLVGSIRGGLIALGILGSVGLAASAGRAWWDRTPGDDGAAVAADSPTRPADNPRPHPPGRATPPPAPALALASPRFPAPRPVEAAPPDDLVMIRVMVASPAGPLDPGPAGPLVAGASVRLKPYVEMIPRPPEIAATMVGPGQWQLQVPRRLLLVGDYPSGVIVASAPGFGVGESPVGLSPLSAGDRLMIVLAPDDVPLEGRITDTAGQPVQGASVQVGRLYAPRSPDLTRWAEQVRRTGTRGAWEATNTRDLTDLGAFPDLNATTAADGRFRLAGLGVERIAELVISAPGHATIEVAATTRNRGPIVTADQGAGLPSLTFHPARFEVALPPGRSVEGTIRDADTGAPIAGVPVEGQLFGEGRRNVPLPGIQATSDERGRYRLDGLPLADRSQVYVRPRAGQPYLNASLDTPNAADLAPGQPLEANLTLRAGVTLRGRITDKTTGQPVVNAAVATYGFRANPEAGRYPGLGGYALRWTRTDVDGRYEVPTLPGPGLVTVHAVTPFRIIRDFAAIAGYDPKTEQFDTLPGFIGNDRTSHALVPIDPKAKAGLDLDIALDPGSRATGPILDPTGQPLAGTISVGLNPSGWPQAVNLRASYEAEALDPQHPRHLFFFHLERKLAGSIILRGDEPGPVPVRLEPWGNVTGRLVRANGQPFTDLSLASIGSRDDPSRGRFVNPVIQPDADGRFRFEGTVAGLRYGARPKRGDTGGPAVFQDLIVEPGQTRDLGEIVIQLDE